MNTFCILVAFHCLEKKPMLELAEEYLYIFTQGRNHVLNTGGDQSFFGAVVFLLKEN